MDEKLSLPDKHFSVTITEESAQKVFAFNLTNGTLHTRAQEGGSISAGLCTAKSGVDIDVTCRVPTVGWYATYNGSIYNETDPLAESSAESFRVDITMDEYKSPRNPADVTLYLKKPVNSSGLTISALPTEFIINIATVPEFKDLKIFNGDEKLATSVKAGFDEHIWDKIKPDMKEALKYKYARHIKKQINFLN
uniref:Uncharacterized protein n=1 Tax=Rhipicephalus zambeziensis TaxID=60191 RepID=A0A224YJZ8_9ACAR